jgi:hypothetical protein
MDRSLKARNRPTRQPYSRYPGALRRNRRQAIGRLAGGCGGKVTPVWHGLLTSFGTLGRTMIHQKIWQALERPELGMLDTISETIRIEEWRNPELLSSIRSGPSLVIATDYGGEHQSARYRSISFVLADLQFLWYWNDLREEIRKTILKDSRRLSYKRLTKPAARALVRFLRATNTIPGRLASSPRRNDRRLQRVQRERLVATAQGEPRSLSPWHRFRRRALIQPWHAVPRGQAPWLANSL